jgi:putative glutamine amidotransferase
VLPRIGLTGSVAPARAGTRRTFLNEPYLLAVREAGGLPLVATPAHQGASLRALYDLMDGLLLTGGEDVEPARYGEAVVHETVSAVPERDDLELTLLEWALADRLPLLAICRGIQILNVAMGGSLVQDLPSQRSGAVRHDQSRGDPALPRTVPHHPVELVPGSFLAGLLGGGPLEVNSLHHQGLARVAPGLLAVGRAPDGLVEAVEAPGAPVPFLVGVQWHPEELLRGGDVASRRLFEGLVAAAGARAGAASPARA